MLYRLRIVATLLLLLIPLLSEAKMPKNMESLEKLPRSIAKDYYIYRFLRERNIGGEDAQKLLEQTKRVNFKLFYLFAKKMDDKGFKKVAKCLRMKTKELLKQDSECIAIGLGVSKALSIDKKRLKKLALRLKDYKTLSSTLEVLSSKNIMQKALKNSNKFIGIFNSAGSYYRKKLFNKEISKRDINRLANIKRFNRSIKIITLENGLQNLQKSLLNISFDKNINEKSYFYLALNALKYHQKDLALKFLDSARKRVKYRFDTDKIIFWKYMITKKTDLLEELNKSFSVNIYTIFAHEKLSTQFTNIVSPQINNGYKKYDIEDPFLWVNLLEKIRDKNSTTLKKIANNFRYKNTLGEYSFIMQRADGYKKAYYPMPFYNLLDSYTQKRKALIFAIARQESLFIPSAVSTSYALGMMQFMPFLARATAKNQKIKNFDLDDMFNPRTAYSFANLHLNYLVKKLHHPLFVAYAYNGGIGYTSRLLKSGKYFQKGEYEPYLSMELITYSETRRYAKRVLANYIIYMQLLGEDVSLEKLIEELK